MTKDEFEDHITAAPEDEAAFRSGYTIIRRDNQGELYAVPYSEAFKDEPIVVANQIQGGGDSVPGVQTIAFNLPNDEKVREAKGAKEERFRVNFNEMTDAIASLTSRVVLLQGDGDYDNAKIFLDSYAVLDDQARTVLGNLEDIPYDIRPIYPDGI